MCNILISETSQPYVDILVKLFFFFFFFFFFWLVFTLLYTLYFWALFSYCIGHYIGDEDKKARNKVWERRQQRAYISYNPESNENQQRIEKQKQIR